MASAGLAANASANDLSKLVGSHAEPIDRIDSHGRTITDEILRDRLTVVSFVSTGCSILCVTRTMALDRLARDLPAPLRGRVMFLAIDTDPAADDASRLRAFADELLGPGLQLHFFPSSAEAVKVVAESLSYPAASLPEPPPTVLVFDRRGQVAMTYGGDPLDAPRIAQDLAVLDTFPRGLDQPPAAIDPIR